MSDYIITDRLLITPLTLSDNRFIFELVNTPSWLRFIGDCNVHSDTQAINHIKNIMDDPDTNYWVARTKRDHVCIGVVTFIKRNYLASHDIGCALLPQFGKKGYAYEAMKAVLDHVLETYGHTLVSAITTAENIDSIRLLEKLGLVFLQNIMVKDERLKLYEANRDRIIISGVVKSFFSLFTNKSNITPRLETLRDICVPGVSITNRYMSKATVFDLTSFIETKKKILTDGTLMEFEEKEIFEETKIVKGIASRVSKYEKKGILYRERFKIKGHKLFQFVKTGQSWKISSVIWEDIEG